MSYVWWRCKQLQMIWTESFNVTRTIMATLNGSQWSLMEIQGNELRFVSSAVKIIINRENIPERCTSCSSSLMMTKNAWQQQWKIHWANKSSFFIPLTLRRHSLSSISKFRRPWLSYIVIHNRCTAATYLSMNIGKSQQSLWRHL